MTEGFQKRTAPGMHPWEPSLISSQLSLGSHVLLECPEHRLLFMNLRVGPAFPRSDWECNQALTQLWSQHLEYSS